MMMVLKIILLLKINIHISGNPVFMYMPSAQHRGQVRFARSPVATAQLINNNLYNFGSILNPDNNLP